MAVTLPLDTSAPWTINGVTYEYDAVEDRWYVVSTVATDQVVDNINTLNQEVIRGFDERDDLIETLQRIEQRLHLLKGHLQDP